jgi:hypothetical protein
MFTDCEYSQVVIKSVESIIEAVGGPAKAARLGGVKPSAVSNWSERGRIPAEQFLVFSAALKKIGKTFDPALFGMREVEEARAG